MAAWTCSECGRQFGRNKQSHDCAPAMTLTEYFSTGPAIERPIFDAVMEHLDALGPVHVEPVSVGIFFKNPRKFAQLRPMQKWIALSFSIPHRIEHRLITRKPIAYGSRYYCVVNLRAPEDVDDDVRGWLAEAYFDSPP